MGFIKKTLKYGLIGYMSTYIGLGSFALYDYNKKHKKAIPEKTANTLVVDDVEITLEDKLKKLTIIGETHIYNAKESGFSEEFIKDYSYVAMEGDGGKGEFDTLTFLASWSFLPAMAYYSCGSGRQFNNKTMHQHAKRNGKKIFYLEKGEDSYENEAELSQRMAFLGISLFSLSMAPIYYYAGKSDLEREDESDRYVQYYSNEESTTEYAVNLGERDKIMAENIIEILENNDEIDSLLCVMGKAHVRGVKEQLHRILGDDFNP